LIKSVKLRSRSKESVINRIAVISSLLFLVGMVSISSIVCNVYAAEPQFNFPAGVSTDSSGNVFVADTTNSRIQKFTNSGIFIRKWGSNGPDNGQFGAPFGIAVDPSGHVFVADTQNNRIQKFSNTGTFIRKWGTTGTENGNFSEPVGVAVDPSGNVFVADQSNNRIQKFSNTGTFITKWGTFSMASTGESLPNLNSGMQGDPFS
jgi:DNA-binding beta-propeller fold protein YncE